MPLKWGIISTGRIANDFVSALKILSENEHKVLAVAARSKERADQFAEKFSIPRAYGSYLELVEDEDVGRYDHFGNFTSTKSIPTIPSVQISCTSAL